MQKRAKLYGGRLIHGLAHLQLRVDKVDQGYGCCRAPCLAQGAQRFGGTRQVAAFAVQLRLKDLCRRTGRPGRAPDGIANQLRRCDIADGEHLFGQGGPKMPAQVQGKRREGQGNALGIRCAARFQDRLRQCRPKRDRAGAVDLARKRGSGRRHVIIQNMRNCGPKA